MPFGLYIKRTSRSAQNELNALKPIDKYTSIPAPSFVDVGKYDKETYLVMTRVHGQQLHQIYHLMSYTERDRLANDLAEYTAELGRCLTLQHI